MGGEDMCFEYGIRESKKIEYLFITARMIE
jgi:hypothetical protein